MPTPPHTSTNPTVAVIGAGPGGLATAMILAARGFDVTCYEAMDRVGGRTSRITLESSRDGSSFHFDRGPTFFMMPYVLEEVFALAGRSLEDSITLNRLDPMYRLLLGRKGQEPLAIDATQDIEEMGRRLSEISFPDGKNFQRFMNDNRTKLNRSEQILRRPIRSALDLVDLETAKVLPILNPHLSVHQLLGKYFKDDLVKLAVSFQSKYLGMSPFECPSLFTILPFIEYEYGVWHPTGGCNAIMTAMAEVFTQLGGTLKLGSPIDQIHFKGATAAGVITDGQVHEHDHVVINADTTWALKKLIPPELRTAGPRYIYSNENLDKKRYSCSTFMLYLGMDSPIDLPHHTIYTSESYRDNLEDITTHGQLSGEDPSIYLCNPSALDSTLAPDGKSALYVLVPTPSLKPGRKPGKTGGKVNWSAEAPELRRVAFQQMEKVFGIENPEAKVEAEMMLTPEDWAKMNINHGATFNLAHNLGQMLHKRPQNRLAGFENLYLTGGGTHPGSGLPTIFLSAQIASKLVCEDAGVSYSTKAAEPELVTT